MVKINCNHPPFGITEMLGEASDNPFKYTGREDDGTGLYYYRARYYSPEMGRFISEDPIGFAGGDVNFYTYVGNNPCMLNDPLGLCFRGGKGIMPGISGGLGESIGSVIGAVSFGTAGSIIGFGIGAPIGMEIGAAIGSSFGVQGVLVGALVGAAVGGYGSAAIGGFAGGLLGGYIGGAIGSIFDKPGAGEAGYGEPTPPFPPCNQEPSPNKCVQ